MPDLVTLGETMVLLTPTRPGLLRHAHHFERFVAGAESNTAIGLARLDHQVAWISRLGDGEFGACVKAAIRGEGVDVSRVIDDPEAPTAIYFKERRRPGETHAYYYRSGSAASRLSVDDLDPAYIQHADYLHLTGITPALSVSCREAVRKAIEIARAGDTIVSFDPNIRYKLWTAEEARRELGELIPKVDIVLAAQEEAALLTGESNAEKAGRRLYDRGPGKVIVKMGGEGALAIEGDAVVYQQAVEVEVVDPVGAGDAFNAGFLSGQLREWSIKDSLKLGAVMGALATTVPGDVEGLPTWQEVRPYLGNSRIVSR